MEHFEKNMERLQNKKKEEDELFKKYNEIFELQRIVKVKKPLWFCLWRTRCPECFKKLKKSPAIERDLLKLVYCECSCSYSYVDFTWMDGGVDE